MLKTAACARRSGEGAKNRRPDAFFDCEEIFNWVTFLMEGIGIVA
jgi:hypothetical protein